MCYVFSFTHIQIEMSFLCSGNGREENHKCQAVVHSIAWRRNMVDVTVRWRVPWLTLKLSETGNQLSIGNLIQSLVTWRRRIGHISGRIWIHDSKSIPWLLMDELVTLKPSILSISNFQKFSIQVMDAWTSSHVRLMKYERFQDILCSQKFYRSIFRSLTPGPLLISGSWTSSDASSV